MPPNYTTKTRTTICVFIYTNNSVDLFDTYVLLITLLWYCNFFEEVVWFKLIIVATWTKHNRNQRDQEDTKSRNKELDKL